MFSMTRGQVLLSIPQGPIQSGNALLEVSGVTHFQFHKVQFRDVSADLQLNQFELSIPQGPIQSGLSMLTVAGVALFQFHKVQFRAIRAVAEPARYLPFNSTRSNSEKCGCKILSTPPSLSIPQGPIQSDHRHAGHPESTRLSIPQGPIQRDS